MIDFAAVAKFPHLPYPGQSAAGGNLKIPAVVTRWPLFSPRSPHRRPASEKGLRQGVIKLEEVAASGSQTDTRSLSFLSLNSFCPNFIGNYPVNDDVSPKIMCCALIFIRFTRFLEIYLFLDEAALHLVAHLLGRHADRCHGAALGQVPAGKKKWNC